MLRATYHVNVLAIRSLEKPVIAAVNGVCAGAGLSLACACDIRLASDAAFFVPGFVGIGLIPDSGGSFFLQRLLAVQSSPSARSNVMTPLWWPVTTLSNWLAFRSNASPYCGSVVAANDR